MIPAILLAVAVLLVVTPLRRRKRKPVVYVQGGPVPVLGAADLYRSVQRVKASLRMGER